MATSGSAHGLQMAVSPVLAPFTPEFRLMLSCLRWPLGPAELNQIAEQSKVVRDWHHLLKVTRRHRVVGLVWRALRRSQRTVSEAETRIRWKPFSFAYR